ncbi:MAG: hypothetical protein M1832_000865 [Thelocarpon impressellum]|nr:MAG: hypothetical protein M1832_000865 [Thelocarpon impressellum]
MMQISQLYVYPVKSLRGVALSEAHLTRQGIVHDRKFMLLKVHHDDPESPRARRLENMHVPYFPEMGLFRTALPSGSDDPNGTVRVDFVPPGGRPVKTIEIPLCPDASQLELLDVTMHQSATKAYEMPSRYSDWFSDCFGYTVLLAYLGGNLRPVLGSFSPNIAASQAGTQSGWLSTMSTMLPQLGSTKDDEGLTFADCAPLLVVTEESLSDVSARLPDGEEMDITKFRPNIVLKGSPAAWDEDYWGALALGPISIALTQNCARCQSINVDYTTGKFGAGASGAVLKRLMKDRRVDTGTKYSPIFGRYGFPGRAGAGQMLRVADGATVTRRNEARTRFDWPGLTN